ncbi:L,D-transpeptidase family protein [Reyranella sp.]|uniref:L,D-transpeptidase family protein n=1 Tax=Reyranella sp. TaxID=1929291 RepID=UPI003C7E0FB2
MRSSLARAWSRAALVLLLTIAGCATAPNPAPPDLPVPPSPSVSPLAAALQGIGIAVPSRGKLVVVNIPSFELVALEDGKSILRSRVVVGRPATPTPELSTAIEAVTFNPSWTPTPAMMRFEGARHMPPGPQNPLGRILFELDNDQLIFLHDTNDRRFFDRSVRAFSHGCVRVEKARALAAWALDVSEADIDRSIARGGTHRELLTANIPVAIVYRTRFPDDDGRLVDYPDIYRQQSAAAAAPSERPSEECRGPL